MNWLKERFTRKDAEPFLTEAEGLPEGKAIGLNDVSVFYGDYRAVKGVSMDIEDACVTALIGPSGCGKSTVIRSINRMNDLVPSARTEGTVLYRPNKDGKTVDLYHPKIDPVEVRRRIGMIFQKPNPFPQSIFDNIAYGPSLLGVRDKDTLKEIVENSLREADLWEEVKNDLTKKTGLELSGGQQQRLCIARTIATNPKIILMDEPCSALDPIATGKIEELITKLSNYCTIVIVTHNMHQAVRISKNAAFFNVRKQDIDGTEVRWGELVDYGTTSYIFNETENPETQAYVQGKFG